MEYKITIRDFTALGLGLAFISVGIDHFNSPDWYEPIVPSILPNPTFWVLASGFFDALFGLLFKIPRTRTWASVSIAWMLVVLYWANFNMWYNDVPFGDQRLTYGWTGTHALRCALQVLLLAVLHFLRISYAAAASASSKGD